MPNIEWAKEVKKQLSIPVSVVGAMQSLKDVDELIAQHLIDMVAFGRSFLADPEWPKKAMNGNEEDIVPCLRCLQCYHISTNHRKVGCSVNPRYLHETFIPFHIPKSNQVKRVVIIGGGPAGMQAAISASQRGHEVILFEKNSQLGGQLCTIEKEDYKAEIKQYLAYLKTQISKLPISIHLSTTATRQLISTYHPDSLLIAIGAEETTPPIKGVTQPHVIHASTAILKANDLESPIVIIGGGTIGSELALELSLNKGKQVTLVEMGNELAPQGNSLYKISLRQKLLASKTLTVHLNCTCKAINSNDVTLQDQNSQTFHVPAKHVILSTGLKSLTEEAHQFYGITPETIMIGDCNSPRIIMDAVFEGHSAAIHL